MRKLLAGVLAAALLSACAQNKKPEQSKSPDPAKTTLEDTITTEMVAEVMDTAERRLEVRALATDYLKQQLPGWQVRGISLSLYAGNIYLIGADVTSGQERRTLDVIARLYVPEAGEPYWKIERATRKRIDLLSNKTLNQDDEDRELRDDDFEPEESTR